MPFHGSEFGISYRNWFVVQKHTRLHPYRKGGPARSRKANTSSLITIVLHTEAASS